MGGAAAAAAAAAIAMGTRGGGATWGGEADIAGDGDAASPAAATAVSAPAGGGDNNPPAAPGADGESKIGGPSPPGDPPALRDDPEFAKYFKMIKMGLPVGAVKNAFERDGLDPAIMDGDHSKPVTRAVPLREDE